MVRMTRTRYERVKDTFFACVTYPPTVRLQLYRLLCTDDPTLLQDLVRYERGSHNPVYMAGLLTEWFMQMEPQAACPGRIGERIGSFGSTPN